MSEEKIREASVELAKALDEEWKEATLELEEMNRELQAMQTTFEEAVILRMKLEAKLESQSVQLATTRDALRELIDLGLCGIDELRDATYEKAETVWNETRSAPRVLWSGEAQLRQANYGRTEIWPSGKGEAGSWRVPKMIGRHCQQVKIIAIATEDSSTEIK